MTMSIDMNIPAKVWILAARGNAPADLASGVKFLFNCEDAEIDEEGDIWIASPQAGHWLDADDLDRVALALQEGKI
jgi:hypothetical protein